MSIILHIGSSKTGTTAIQDFCTRYANILSIHKIYYPISYQGFNLSFGGNAHALLYQALDEGRISQVLEFLSICLIEQNKRECQHTLLSAESLSDLSICKKSQLLRLVQEFFGSIRIISYLRDPIEWISRASHHTDHSKDQDFHIRFASHQLRMIYEWASISQIHRASFEIYSYAKRSSNIIYYWLQEVLDFDPKAFRNAFPSDYSDFVGPSERINLSSDRSLPPQLSNDPDNVAFFTQVVKSQSDEFLEQISRMGIVIN